MNLKEEILACVEEFRQSKTRDEKKKILVKRRDEYIESNRSNLVSLFRSCEVSKLLDVSKFSMDLIEPKLVLCNGDRKLFGAWKYLRTMCSSLPWTGYYGRNMYYLVVDKVSGCCMSILGLGSDFMSMKPRDDYIGWNKKDKFGYKMKGNEVYNGSFTSWKAQKKEGVVSVDNKISNLMNIHTCVSLNPFSVLTSGKLSAMLAFSDTVLDDFYRLYQEKLAGITTTSVYGKSIQYSGISDYMKFLGFTKGVGTLQFPLSIIEKIKEYYLAHQSEKKWDDIALLGLQPKAKMIQLVCKELGISSNIMMHNHQKGIYFGYTCVNSRDFLTGRKGKYIKGNQLKKFKHRSVSDIFNDWRNRFMLQRKSKFIPVNEASYIIKEV